MDFSKRFSVRADTIPAEAKSGNKVPFVIRLERILLIYLRAPSDSIFEFSVSVPNIVSDGILNLL